MDSVAAASTSFVRPLSERCAAAAASDEEEEEEEEEDPEALEAGVFSITTEYST
jgi:ribosomal protein L12E/L44/L45/RPP1/RPP2